jgi:hypothetical protein
MGRRVPGNGQRIVTTVYGADRWSTGLARSLAIATNTFSPMAAGTHDTTGGTSRGFSGDPGYGVSRWAGRTPPRQALQRIAAPVAAPMGARLGIGAGVAGQPGLPSTGTDRPDSSMGWLSYGQLGTLGLGH